MVIEVNYDSAESTINSLKCDELKALLSIDQLPRSGRKDELRQRCLAHVRSSLRSEQFLNAIKAAAAAQSNQVLNQSILKLNSIYINLFIYLKKFSYFFKPKLGKNYQLVPFLVV